jgi:hypothetical protein
MHGCQASRQVVHMQIYPTILSLSVQRFLKGTAQCLTIPKTPGEEQIFPAPTLSWSDDNQGLDSAPTL